MFWLGVGVMIMEEDVDFIMGLRRDAPQRGGIEL